jgi:hypothetical protein
MDVCTNFKDIRFNYEDGLKVYRRGVITKTQIATAEDFIYVNDASYPIAKKFNSIIDIDVKSNDEWKHVNYGDYDNLFKVFNEEEADTIAPTDEDDIIESAEGSREYDPEIDDLPPVDEEIVDAARTEIAEESPVDANELKELSDATDAIEEVEENVVESNTEDNTDSNVDQEPVASEVEPTSDNNQNNKYSFKKKKRHS